MSARGQTADMVQPKPESPGGGSSGDISLGKPEMIPPEISNHEAFQRLWVENQDLRVALEQSNTMLRKTHSEMLEFQDAQRREQEFIAYRFSEAKTLVQRLTEERESLRAKLEEARKPLADVISGDTRKDIQTEEDKMEDSTCIHRLQKMVEEEEPIVRVPLTETVVLQETGDSSAKIEQDLRAKVQDAEVWKAQLQDQMKLLQEEISDLKRQLAEQSAEAQQKLQQLVEEKMSIKSQVTSLLGELNESQMSLEASLQEKRKLEESLRSSREQQREYELQMKQHVIQLDQRRMQVQNLEAALKVERQNTSEEMRKLAQIQAAYHKLFQEYDVHIKTSLQQEKIMKTMDIQLQELKQQLQEAEEALVAKQELIDKLKVESEEQKGLKETITVLKAQAEIFRSDFVAEREARERLHAEKQQLLEKLEELQRERVTMVEMRNRHSDTLHPSLPGPFQSPYLSNSLAPSLHTVEPQEYCCPKCQYKAPDIDTLQIHVMDCIQ